MSRIALVPGSFDPITVAHVDIIRRALPLFDKLIIGIGSNVTKQSFLSLDQRQQMVNAVFANDRVKVVTYDGLTVNCCQREGAHYMVRGIRTVADFEYEKGISQLNQVLVPVIETIFILSRPGYSSISSTIVRDILRCRGDVSAFVPPEAMPFLCLSGN